MFRDGLLHPVSAHTFAPACPTTWQCTQSLPYAWSQTNSTLTLGFSPLSTPPTSSGVAAARHRRQFDGQATALNAVAWPSSCLRLCMQGGSLQMCLRLCHSTPCRPALGWVTKAETGFVCRNPAVAPGQVIPPSLLSIITTLQAEHHDAYVPG